MRILRWPSRCILLLAALLVPIDAPAAANRGGRLRLDLRHGDFQDPGVVLLRGARAWEVRRVWFGETESPAAAPGEPPGVTVAVPPGVLRSRVPVRAELEDGSLQRIGTFRYVAALFPRGRNLVAVGSGQTCYLDGAGGDELGSARTSSSVTLRKDGSFLYSYRLTNTFPSEVTILWSSLEALGYPGGISATLGPGESRLVELEDSSPPVLMERAASADRRPGCSTADPDAPVSWYGGAYLPASRLPANGPPRNLQSYGGGLLAWEDPEEGPPERYVITYRFIRGDPWARRGQHRVIEFTTPRGATTAYAGHMEYGVESACVRPLRDGFLGEPAIAYTVR